MVNISHEILHIFIDYLTYVLQPSALHCQKKVSILLFYIKTDLVLDVECLAHIFPFQDSHNSQFQLIQQHPFDEMYDDDM